MDITSSLRGPPGSSPAPLTGTAGAGARPHPKRSHSRSSSLLGFLNPSASTPNLGSVPPAPRAAGRPRSASLLGFGFVTGGSGGGGGDVGEVDPEMPLPTFEVQPAMLAVDLVLAPGESKSCQLFF
jgi:RAB6A-GEF complex partner protein 2